MLRAIVTLLMLCGVFFCAGCKTRGDTIQVVKLEHSIVQEVWEFGTPQSVPLGYTKGVITLYCQITLYIDGRFVRQDTYGRGWEMIDAYYRGTWRIDPETSERILIDTEGNVSRLDPDPEPIQNVLQSQHGLHAFYGLNAPKQVYARPAPHNPYANRQPPVPAEPADPQ